MSADLDLRAREAAGAARRSVASVAAAAAGGDPPSWRAMAGWRIALAAMVVVLAGAAAGALSRGDGPTRITSGPAAPTETALPPSPVTTLPPPPPGPPPPSPAGQVAASGTASNGARWTLHIGGPSNELCLSFGVDEHNTGGACAGRPFGEPLPADERYRPLRLEDDRMPLHVFGRVPPGIVEVEVELAAGAVTRRGPVLRSGQAGEGDGFYVVEVDREPVAVVGIRADGTKVRYELWD